MLACRTAYETRNAPRSAASTRALSRYPHLSIYLFAPYGSQTPRPGWRPRMGAATSIDVRWAADGTRRPSLVLQRLESTAYVLERLLVSKIVARAPLRLRPAPAVRAAGANPLFQVRLSATRWPESRGGRRIRRSRPCHRWPPALAAPLARPVVRSARPDPALSPSHVAAWWRGRPSLLAAPRWPADAASWCSGLARLTRRWRLARGVRGSPAPSWLVLMSVVGVDET